MQALRKISMAAVRMQLAYKPLARFSGDNWKDRDEAAEKVYISQAEKETIKKLLRKVEEEEEDRESNLEEFQRKLSQIMRRYRLESDELRHDILRLHQNLAK